MAYKKQKKAAQTFDFTIDQEKCATQQVVTLLNKGTEYETEK